MNAQITVLRKKIAALNTEGTLMVMKDFFDIINDTLEESLGMQLKRDGNPMVVVEVVNVMEALYKQQLAELLKKEGSVNVRQISIYNDN